MRVHPVLACAALAAAALASQAAPAPGTPEPTDIQGVPTSPPPSSLPPSTPRPALPPSAPAPFTKPSGVVTPDYSVLPSQAARVIVNYWDAVRDMMLRVQAAPPRPALSAGRPGDLRPDYPFEEFRNLRGMDLVRAAHEGALDARRKKAGRSPEEIDRQVWENAALALEYFPIVVRDEKDVQTLARIVEDREEDLQLRRFVLDRLAPDQKTPSLLSLYLDDACVRFPAIFKDVLEEVSGHPMEDPSLQVDGMRVCHARLMKRYLAVLHADPLILEREKKTGQPVAPAAVLAKDAPAMEKATRERLAELGVVIGNFAALIAAHIEVNSASDAKVKAETRVLLQRIADEVLVPDRERILRYLDPSRPAPVLGDQIPLPPVMPDSEGGEPVAPNALPGAETGLPVEPSVTTTGTPSATPVPLPPGL